MPSRNMYLKSVLGVGQVDEDEDEDSGQKKVKTESR